MDLLRITFEYEDEIRILKGEKAKKWLEAIDNVHDREFPKFKWEIIKKDKKVRKRYWE